MTEEYEDQALLEKYAREMWRVSFSQLSPFGQKTVRNRIAVANYFSDQSQSEAMRGPDLAHALQAAQARVAQLEQENKDLWEDNEELRIQLTEKEEYEDNNHRSRGRREAGTSESTFFDV
jgi:hypothetical protein